MAMETIAIERWKRTFKYMRLFLLFAFVASLLCTLTIAGLIIFAKWKGLPFSRSAIHNFLCRRRNENW